MRVETYRYGEPRADDGRLRLGVTRYPPRGKTLEESVAAGLFDVRLPLLAPSRGLLATLKDKGGFTPEFGRRYREELAAPLPGEVLALLTELHALVPYEVGCFCERPERCHRTILAELLAAAPRPPRADTPLRERLLAFVREHGKELGEPDRRALRHLAERLP